MPERSPLPVAGTLTGKAIELTVTSLGGLGDGIATYNDKPVFIPKSVIGDQLRVRIVHENRDGLQAQIEEILTPGPERNIPPCRYFETCGGCSLQQFSADYYRAFKTRILRSAITHAGFNADTAEVVFLEADTRRRVEFKIAAEARVLSFHAPRSHTPVIINECIILHPKLQAMMPILNAHLAQWEFTPQLFAISLTLTDSGIDMLMTFRHEVPPLAKYTLEIEGIDRISIRSREGKPGLLAEKKPVTMNLGGYAIPLPADAFLQATIEGQQRLTDAAMAACEGATSVIDLFCGLGTYSFAASHKLRVHAVEGDSLMMQAMKQSIKQHAISNLTCQQRDLFKQPFSAKELAAYDAAIINPPRLGAKAQCEELGKSSISRIAMISCNPATFARDAKILKNYGFNLSSASGVDQFVFSPHLEVVSLFCR